MKECEDCGEEAKRRTRCKNCGALVCVWCLHHVHHTPWNEKPKEEEQAA